MDNFYTSVLLFEQLLQQGFYAAGTIKPNRKNLPKDFPPKKLESNESKFYTKS